MTRKSSAAFKKVCRKAHPDTGDSEEHLKELNSACSYSYIPENLTKKNARQLIKSRDIIVDCSDNFETRYLINTISREFSIPLVSASILKFQAQISVFNYKGGPCYECLYPSQPPNAFMPNCSENGVIGSLPGVAGSIQATEVFKILLGLNHSQRIIINDYFVTNPNPSALAINIARDDENLDQLVQSL